MGASSLPCRRRHQAGSSGEMAAESQRRMAAGRASAAIRRAAILAGSGQL